MKLDSFYLNFDVKNDDEANFKYLCAVVLDRYKHNSTLFLIESALKNIVKTKSWCFVLKPYIFEASYKSLGFFSAYKVTHSPIGKDYLGYVATTLHSVIIDVAVTILLFVIFTRRMMKGLKI